jgi:hypothetical protein
MYSSSFLVFGMDEAPGADDWMTDRNLKDELTLSLGDPSKVDNVGIYEDMT